MCFVEAIKAKHFLRALPLVLTAACSSPPIPEVPTGEIAYMRYCASCHGESGRGDGLVARELRTPPTDLTKLSERSGGRFDEASVLASIDGRREVAAHGSRTMPVWGVVFESELREKDTRYPRYVTLLSARTLTEYLRTMQAPRQP